MLEAGVAEDEIVGSFTTRRECRMIAHDILDTRTDLTGYDGPQANVDFLGVRASARSTLEERFRCSAKLREVNRRVWKCVPQRHRHIAPAAGCPPEQGATNVSSRPNLQDA